MVCMTSPCRGAHFLLSTSSRGGKGKESSCCATKLQSSGTSMSALTWAALFCVHCHQYWCSRHWLPCHVAQHVLPLISHAPMIVQNHQKMKSAGRMMKMTSLRHRKLTWLSLYQMTSSDEPLLLPNWLKSVLSTSPCSRRVRESHTLHLMQNPKIINCNACAVEGLASGYCSKLTEWANSHWRFLPNGKSWFEQN